MKKVAYFCRAWKVQAQYLLNLTKEERLKLSRVDAMLAKWDQLHVTLQGVCVTRYCTY